MSHITATYQDDFKHKKNRNNHKQSGQVNIREALVPDASLWWAIVGMFTNMQQEVYIVKVINFDNLAMMYKFIEWFMLLSAPVLWIGLLIMAKKGREILYWWYPSV